MKHIAVFACLVSVALAAPARAEGSDEDARRHYDEATKAFDVGDFARAVAEYKAAYGARPDPAFLYNTAQAYRLAGDARQAIFFYRSYLRNARNAPNRREVEDRIRKLEASARSAPPPTSEPTPPPKVEPAAPKVEPTPAAPEPAPVPEPTTTLVSTPADTPHAADKPVYKKWWLWTAVGGAVVVGVGLGVGLGLGLDHNHAPNTALGTTDVF
jgi:hypothetical protein